MVPFVNFTHVPVLNILVTVVPELIEVEVGILNVIVKLVTLVAVTVVNAAIPDPMID